MPNLYLLRDELARAVSGQGTKFFELVSFNHYSTRWRTAYAGKTIIIAYNHRLRVPVTVWEEGFDSRKDTPNPVKMEDYLNEQADTETTAEPAAEDESHAGTDAELVGEVAG